jgi:tripeptidyl-peptidase-1
MVPFRKLLAVTLLAGVTSAGNLVLHESRSTAPSGFISHGPAPPDEVLTLRVALTSNNVAGLEEKLTSLATPGSSEFRQWLSMAEVRLVSLYSFISSCIPRSKPL